MGQWVGAFSCKGSGYVYQKWSLASPTDLKKNMVEMQEDFLRKFSSCVCYLQT